MRFVSCGFFPSETCHFSNKSTWTGNFFVSLFPCTLLGLTALIRELLFLPSHSLFQRLLRMSVWSYVQKLRYLRVVTCDARVAAFCCLSKSCILFQAVSSAAKLDFLKSFSGNCGEAKNEVKISSCFVSCVKLLLTLSSQHQSFKRCSFVLGYVEAPKSLFCIMSWGCI